MAGAAVVWGAWVVAGAAVVAAHSKSRVSINMLAKLWNNLALACLLEYIQIFRQGSWDEQL